MSGDARLGGGDITPEEFVERFRSGDTRALNGVRVRGNVSLYSETIDRAVRATNVTFLGDVNFSDCRFERSLDLSDCYFAKTLVMSHSSVGGELDLSGSEIASRTSPNRAQIRDAASLDLTGLDIGSDLNLEGVRIHDGKANPDRATYGSLVAPNLRVGGRTFMGGMKLDGHITAPGSRFGGDVYMQVRDEARTLEPLMHVLGSIDLTGCVFERQLVLSGVLVVGDFNMWSSVVESVLFVRAFHTPGGARLGNEICGDWHLAATRIRYFDAESVVVRGELRVFAAKLGRFMMVMDASRTRNRLGTLVMDGATVENNVKLLGLVVTGDKSHSGRGISFDDCRISGDLGFWSAYGPLAQNAGRQPEAADLGLRTIVNGDLSTRGARVGGRLDLTCMDVSGRILLDDLHVTQDLRIQSLRSARAAIRKAGMPLPDGAALDLSTRTNALSMTNLECANDIDLTGLHLVPRDTSLVSDLEVEPPAGHLDARGCRVAKALRLFAPGADGDGAAAVVPGSIDLTGGDLGELAVSFQSFDTGAEGLAAEIGIVLTNARIGEFTLPDSVLGMDDLKLPRPMDMRGLQVGQWNIFDAEKARRTGLTRRSAFETLTEADDRFRRSTYLRIEQTLREGGHGADADYIYRRMSEEAARVQRADRRLRRADSGANVLYRLGSLLAGGGRNVLHVLNRIFLGHGTQPWILMLYIVGFFLLTLPGFSSPANFEPSLDYLGAESARFDAPAPPRAGDQPADWDAASALAASLEHHLPVVTLGLQDEWDLRHTGTTCYRLPSWLMEGPLDSVQARYPSCGGVRLRGAPESWGMIIAVLNWIAWPFVLAFAINRLIRIRQMV